MIATASRLADRLVAHLVPRAEAKAAYQCQCNLCAPTRAEKRCRDCVRGVCEPWFYYGCDSC